MNESSKTWYEKAADAIRVATGDEGAEVIEAEWRKLDATSRPIVTVFGSYDSGKSTLLKRLLVDAGVDVPSWLTVSARRETFEVSEVGALGCLFRDTPGIAGGNTEHEQMALEAVTLSDVILLVVPPQLVTGDRDAIISVLSGEAFRRGGLPMADAVLPVIARLDEGSVDPTEDREGYEDYLTLKRNEWAKLLESARVKLSGALVFTVAADPFQGVGNAQSPSPSDYQKAYREWDGVEALSKVLESLPSRLSLLRSASHRRFLCSRMEALRQGAESRRTDVKLACDLATEDRERFSLFVQQLDALMSSARALLEGAVEEELLTAARSRVEKAEVFEQFFLPRMHKALGRWWDEQTASLQKLIGEAEAQIDARARSMGAAKARVVFGINDTQVTKEGFPFKEKKLGTILNKAQALLNDHHEKKLGMTLSKAREELKKLDKAKDFAEYAKETGRRVSFKTLEEAKKARMIVGIYAFASAAPLVIELGGLLWDELQRRKLEKERAERRTALRETLRSEASKIADETWNEWRQTSDQYLDWIRLHANAAKTREETLREELWLIEATTAKLGSALA
jgi:50S ribosome-binding GTPase